MQEVEFSLGAWRNNQVVEWPIIGSRMRQQSSVLDVISGNFIKLN